MEEKNDITLAYDNCLFIQIDVVKNNLEKKITLIDVAIPSDKNTFTKVSHLLLK